MAAAVLTASLAIVLAVSTITDIRERLIPDAVLAPAAVVSIGVSAASQQALLWPRIGAGAAAGGFLLAAALARPGGMGLGDVKLAAVMGLHLGPAVAWALVAGLASGALAGAVLRAATIPLAPHLALGTALVGIVSLA